MTWAWISSSWSSSWAEQQQYRVVVIMMIIRGRHTHYLYYYKYTYYIGGGGGGRYHDFGKLRKKRRSWRTELKWVSFPSFSNLPHKQSITFLCGWMCKSARDILQEKCFKLYSYPFFLKKMSLHNLARFNAATCFFRFGWALLLPPPPLPHCDIMRTWL